MTSATSSPQPIFCYRSPNQQMHFFESKTGVFARHFFNETIKDYPLDPSYLELIAIPASKEISTSEIISSLLENRYFPTIRDGKVRFQKQAQASKNEEESKESPPLRPEIRRQLKKQIQGIHSLFDDRETRSDLYTPGIMVVDRVDSATGEIICKFTSAEDSQRLNQTMSERLAAFGHYGRARHLAEKAGTLEAIPTLTWIEKALNATAEQVQKEKYGETAYNYRLQASEVANSRKDKEKTYEECIRQLKKDLKHSKMDLEAFFNRVREARSLKPHIFEPFYFFLIHLAPLAELDPKTFEEIVNDAYKISPLQTFNFLILYYGIRIGGGTSLEDPLLEGLLKALHERFPLDAVVGMAIHDFTTNAKKTIVENSEEREETLRSEFAKHLEEALQFVRARDLASARASFSQAAHHHISDKRPLMYRALIDLKEGDSLSALKQITEFGRAIQWNSPEQQKDAKRELFEYFQSEEKTSIKFDAPLETSALKSLLKLFQSAQVKPEALADFQRAMNVYLTDADADPLWAQLAIDIALEHVGGIQACLSRKETWDVFMDLCGTLPCFLYELLSREKEDLGELEAFFEQKEDGRYSLTVSFRTTEAVFKAEPFRINPRSFEITSETRVPYLKNLLEETYVQHCLLFARIAMDLDNLSEVVLENCSTTDRPLDASLVSVLLERYDAEGTEEQRVQFLNWASTHFSLYPESQRENLTQLAMKWQLNQPIPCFRADLLKAAGDKWLLQANPSLARSSRLWDASSIPASSPAPVAPQPSNSLEIAFQTWSHFHRQELNQAATTLQLFFQDWEASLGRGIDPITLRALCLARVLLDHRGLIQPQLLPSLSPRNLELAEHALSLLSREGVIKPYIIPDQPIAKETIQKLCLLYLGQKRDETDLEYEKRLEESQIPDFTNLRHSKRFKGDEKSDTPDKGWVFPFHQVHTLRQVRATIEEIQTRHQFRLKKNQQIASEKPKYTQDSTFIKWVTRNRDLVSKYQANPQSVKKEIEKLFPKFPGKKEFLEELQAKGEHEAAFQILKKNTPKAEEDPNKRFWQLIDQVSQLVETVASSKRSEQSFDLFVMSEKEAHFAMQLIYEWGLTAWGDQDMQRYAEAFHGPEIHIWGKGPRLPHFNAGIYFSGKEKPSNVHIFY